MNRTTQLLFSLLLITACSACVSFNPLNQRTLDFGAKLSRIETHITHPGEGSQVDLGGVYLLDARHHADTTTVVQYETFGELWLDTCCLHHTCCRRANVSPQPGSGIHP